MLCRNPILFILLLGCAAKNKGALDESNSLDQDHFMRPLPFDVPYQTLDADLKMLESNSDPLNPTWNENVSYVSLAIALLHGSQSSRFVISSRSHALNCLLTDPGFESLFRSHGGHLSYRVLMALNESAQTVHCATLAVVSWSKWLHTRGAGASAVNQESIVALAEWVWRRRKKVGDAWAGYALGLAHSLTPRWQGGNAKRSEIGFKTALKVKPVHPLWILDFVEYNLEPLQKENEIKNNLSQLHRTSADLNEAYRKRLNLLAERYRINFDDE